MTDQSTLDGAHRAIERWGWREATLERIATEAGVSRMTLHRRGITREGLLGALAQRLEDEYRAGMWPALTAPGSGRERLEQALGRLLRGRRGQPRGPRRAGRGRPQRDLPRGRSPRADAGLAFTEPIRRLLQDGAADGSLAADDPEETATLLLNLVSWTYRHLRRGHGWDAERARDSILRIALDGVAAPVTPTGPRQARPGRACLRTRVRRHGPGRDPRAAALPHRPARDLLWRRGRARARHERRARRPSSRCSGWAPIASRSRG